MKVGYVGDGKVVQGLRVIAESVEEYNMCAEYMKKIDHRYCEHGFIHSPTLSMRMNETCVFDWKIDRDTVPMCYKEGAWEMCTYEETGIFVDIGKI